MPRSRAAVLVVGSVALDDVTTAAGVAHRVLGGSATYFAYAASFLSRVRLLGVVGDDFPAKYRRVLQERNIDTRGLRTVPGRTFRWSGRYEADMNTRVTTGYEMGVFGDFRPEVPEEYVGTEYAFLANGSPMMQRQVRAQLRAKFVACDTMRHWIERERGALRKLLSEVDGVVMNDEEARLFTGEHNLVAASKMLCRSGPRFVAVKKGEHGTLLAVDGNVEALPACPLEEVRDPTGAGDAFAGGLIGYLARVDRVSPRAWRTGAAYGTVMASFAVSDFSLEGLRQADGQRVRKRLAAYRRMFDF